MLSANARAAALACLAVLAIQTQSLAAPANGQCWNDQEIRESLNSDFVLSVVLSLNLTNAPRPLSRCVYPSLSSFPACSINNAMNEYLRRASGKCEVPPGIHEIFAGIGGKNAYREGNKYLNGQGVPRDDRAAMAFYFQAGDYGPAFFAIGYMYENGLGVSRDYKVALEMYRKAAAKNEPSAFLEIGYLYDKGYGVSENPEEAFRWFSKAASLNNTIAMRNLCEDYGTGRGVPINVQAALAWCRKALANARAEGDSETETWASGAIGELTQGSSGSSQGYSPSPSCHYVPMGDAGFRYTCD